MNIQSIALLAAIALALLAAVVAVIREKKRGCGGGCSGCPYSGRCEKEQNKP